MQRHRGMIFITALGIIVVLTGLLLVFAQNMRTELVASANRLSAIQADATEHGAEQWVMAQIDTDAPDAMTITQTPADAVQIGSGYFWIIRSDETTENTLAYGIADESGKLNLNTATPEQMMNLPNMTQTAADSIADWVDADDSPHGSGAETSFGYIAKNSAMESPEEVLLVNTVTPDLLYGYDRNHDGIVDDTEKAAGGSDAMFSTSGSGAGIFPDITVFSVEPNTASDGTARFNVRIAMPRPSQLSIAFRNMLSSANVPAADISQIMDRINRVIATRPSGVAAFNSLGDFYTAAAMNAADLALVADRVTASTAKTLRGMINVNTAPAEALACLPGLDAADADTLVASRGGADTSNFAWVFTALSSQKASGIAGSITARSYQYSADIVAVSPEGRAFKRVRIVVDARQIPSKIIYRKDLTALGWPLDASIRDNLRAGQTLTTGTSTLKTGLN